MRLVQWLPMYRQICTEFGFSEEDDIASAHLLAELLMSRAIESVKVMDSLLTIFPKDVYICGGGTNLENELKSIPQDAFLIAADGAMTSLKDQGLIPKMIVTDLDGEVSHQVHANEHGSIVFVHAHGDNMPALRKHVRSFTGPVVGTCQCEPVIGLYNFGGFTDGDRAVCIAAELGAARVNLLGFDFSNPSFKPGRPAEIKLRKLKWAERIIDHARNERLEVHIFREGG